MYVTSCFLIGSMVYWYFLKIVSSSSCSWTISSLSFLSLSYSAKNGLVRILTSFSSFSNDAVVLRRKKEEISKIITFFYWHLLINMSLKCFGCDVRLSFLEIDLIDKEGINEMLLRKTDAYFFLLVVYHLLLMIIFFLPLICKYFFAFLLVLSGM